MAVQWGGRLHGGERRKASSVLPPTRAVDRARVKKGEIVKSFYSNIKFISEVCHVYKYFLICVYIFIMISSSIIPLEIKHRGL